MLNRKTSEGRGGKKSQQKRKRQTFGGLAYFWKKKSEIGGTGIDRRAKHMRSPALQGKSGTDWLTQKTFKASNLWGMGGGP